jgi:uncharacterized membrane protein YgcG
MPFAGSAQTPPPQATPPQTQTFTANQLTDLVAPIALYPDGLLSQVLVASTYPLEVVEAQQWLQQNSTLHGTQLTEAAKQQPWDPSVQALVAFPDVLKRLNQDIRWTTDVGNAFLAQEADVMAAVQQLRASAQANGRLTSTPQQTVSTETQGGQAAIAIQPANPDVLYVPTYDPAYVWGPPVSGFYPSLYYPTYGFGWGPGINLGFWGGWGWAPNWFGGVIFVDNDFFHRHGFHGDRDRRFDRDRGFNRERWAHNPDHRLGVPYPNRQLAGRFQAASAASRANHGGFGASNPVNQPNGGRNALQGARPDNRPNANRPAMPGNPQGFRDMSPRVSPQGGAARSFPTPQSPPMRIAPPINPSPGGGAPRGGAARSFPTPQSPPMRIDPRNNPSFGGGGLRGFGGGGHFGGAPGGGRSFGGGRGFSGGGGGGRGFGGGGGGHGGGGHR